MPALDPCYFVEEAPEFDYRGGLFHITQQIGNETFERVMSPHIFMVALRKAAEVAKKHRFGSAEVIDFERVKA